LFLEGKLQINITSRLTIVDYVASLTDIREFIHNDRIAVDDAVADFRVVVHNRNLEDTPISDAITVHVKGKLLIKVRCFALDSCEWSIAFSRESSHYVGDRLHQREQLVSPSAPMMLSLRLPKRLYD
jgi:hypothetical protein